MSDTQRVDEFIERWAASSGAERSNYQLFLSELSELIGVERPQPAQSIVAHNAYVFDKRVPLPHGTTGYIDLYKRNCFVLEAKQGSDKVDAPELVSAQTLQQFARRKKGTAVRGTAGWDTAMEKAKKQGERYIRNLPPEEIRDGRPPFLLVVDVGNTIELYAEFSRTGGNYIPFPDPHSYRLELADLRDTAVRQTLAQIWTEPMTLDPSRKSAKVTREIAGKLAQLAISLEGEHEAERVAAFLMRCLFTMFAEDVGLLPEKSFAQLLLDIEQDAGSFKQMVEHLWQTMNTGGFSVILRKQIPHFNGGLFANPFAIALDKEQLRLLAEAAQYDWRDVEPAIFGTLLERALNPIERHKLGAHYTPRAYVERLVQPTVIEPLREEWDSVKVAAVQLAEDGQADKAIAEVEAFQRKLATVRILDPACGSGNFLYVTLELLKRLEGEVLNTRRDLGAAQAVLEMQGVTVTPQQFLGIEVNPRAAAIAELVLWIGYLQWHFRTRGQTNPPEPIIKNYHNIECRDAVLAWERIEPLLDKNGQPVTRWDGRTMKTHPTTGEEVPDETARVPAHKYIKPRRAAWPQADYIVGNPPFIGNKRMRFHLGDGYTDAIRSVYAKDVPKTADYVMFWWDTAARLTQSKKAQQFGLIATNSLTQVFNRSVVENYLYSKKPLSLTFAIPDHPWVDSSDGAAVRISMTVCVEGDRMGNLRTVVDESPSNSGFSHQVILGSRNGKILADLMIGADVTRATALEANDKLASQGANPLGLGFRLTRREVEKYGYSINNLPKAIRPYKIGRDLVQRAEEKYVIDFWGLSASDAKQQEPMLFQHLLTHVKPERDQNRRKSRRENWWLFGEGAPMFRDASEELGSYIGTCRTAKHRIFTMLDAQTIPDAKIVAIALSDLYYLGVLSSKIHVSWAFRTGGWLGVGNDSNYNHSDCFGKFPFPDPTEAQKERIRQLGEQLDAHRKRQQAQHPTLTMTGMYNVLEKLRAGEPLDDKEREIHEQGLVSILQQLHDELDEAVFAAYGWPPTLSDEEILEKLVALNKERAAEEAQGKIRYLRPEYQNPEYAAQAQQNALLTVAETSGVVSVDPQAWPKGLTQQVTAVRQVLGAASAPLTADEVASSFKGRQTKKKVGEVTEILETLVMLGQVASGEKGTYLGV